MTQPTVTLAGGTNIPMVGLGTWPMDDAEARRVVRQAIEIGYRHVDTAENYANERGVGDGIRDSGLDRSEVWVTTKFNRRWHADPAAGLRGNLERLGLDYVDLALIHWPNPDQDRYVQAWQGLIELREQGLARAIGTSNFKPAHLGRLIAETGVAPEVNQIECHPYLDRAAERAYHAEHGIVTAAWSPLGRNNGLLQEPLIVELAARYGVTPGQVVLAWDVLQGMVTVPKSSNPERLRQNLDVFDIPLTAADVAALTSLESPGLVPADSDVFGH
nr:aldo/keto reductase [Propionibacterium sp.]